MLYPCEGVPAESLWAAVVIKAFFFFLPIISNKNTKISLTVLQKFKLDMASF